MLRRKVIKNKSTGQLTLTIPDAYAGILKLRSRSVVFWDYDKVNDRLIIQGTKRGGGK